MGLEAWRVECGALVGGLEAFGSVVGAAVVGLECGAATGVLVGSVVGGICEF